MVVPRSSLSLEPAGPRAAQRGAPATVPEWADRIDGWRRDLPAARDELGLDYSPDPFLFRCLARLMRAGHHGSAGAGSHQPTVTDIDDAEAGVKTGPGESKAEG